MRPEPVQFRPKRTKLKPDMPTSAKFRKKLSTSRPARRDRGRPWRRCRQEFFESDPMHRLCAECLKSGQTVVAVICDHIVPVSEAPEREFDQTNLQGLCQRHSDLKTAAENRGER